MKILFLDFAELDSDDSLTHIGAMALRQNHGLADGDLVFINLQNLARRYSRAPYNLRTDEEVRTVREQIDRFGQFDRVYLAFHGRLRDNRYCYTNIGAASASPQYLMP